MPEAPTVPLVVQSMDRLVRDSGHLKYKVSAVHSWGVQCCAVKCSAVKCCAVKCTEVYCSVVM